jgi:nucleotide-binding universal stress UspA family protein
MGNVADKIVRGSGIPTLLIRVKEGQVSLKRKALIQRILLPLDTSDASRMAVPYAVYLAKKMNAGITLFSMAQTIYAQTLDGGSMGMSAGVAMNWDSVDAATEKITDEYLQKVEDDINKEGVKADHTAYLGMDAAYEILEMEKKIQADLIVMATRGRSPVARWAFGSVAEKVLREGDTLSITGKRKE